MADVLLDTGAWYAILDRRERAHGPCVEAFQGVTGRLLTTEAVLTETLWLLEGVREGPRRCAEFVRRDAVVLVPTSAESLARAVALMEKYRDMPMDFADATLVTLGEEMGLDTILTLDRRGFGVYRLHGRRSFHTLP